VGKQEKKKSVKEKGGGDAWLHINGRCGAARLPLASNKQIREGEAQTSKLKRKSTA
jgi:hypothetical protein